MSVARKKSKRRATRLHDPERTRGRLLQAASRVVYRSGFQSASLDAILAATGVTKGALYYHFDSKEAQGYAIVEEIIAPELRGSALFNNLAQEMSPLDEGFRQRLAMVFRAWGGGHCGRFARRTAPGNGSPRRETR